MSASAANDPPRAAKFYDELLAVVRRQAPGRERALHQLGHVTRAARPLLLIKPFNGQPATAGNGAMVALSVDSKAKVDAVYKKAIELGAKDEGPAGARSPDFYAAFFRDPEGNKLAVYHSS